MTGSRRFSQAIAEGDGISLLAAVRDADAARSAAAHGAEGIVAQAELPGLREATDLPILWRAASPEDARRSGADACLLPVGAADGEEEELDRLHGEARAAGLEPVIAVADEDELRLALDVLDPEILLLSGHGAEDGDGLEHVLGLLPDVPAGKLAVAELELRSRDEVAELERAGVDAVIVRAEDVAALAGDLQAQR